MWKNLGIAFLGGLAIDIGIHFIIWTIESLSKKSKYKQKLTFHTLFFPSSEVACIDHFTKRHGCNRSPSCGFSHDNNNTYGELLKSLGSAQYSIDIAVFCFTGRELASVLVMLHEERGVVVRVITDKEQIESAGSQVGYLRSKGIQVRHNDHTFYMHHKFAIIDNKLLINGSFNWTRAAITGNNENLLITNYRDIVKEYTQEFDQLWIEFDPKKKII